MIFFFSRTNQYEGKRLQFDKVLCDVPCTGDGAARKLPSRWVKWSCRDGNVIHPLQLSILMRALQVCKIGGLVMYSTCSLNPVEDEAVVTEAFRRAVPNSFELVIYILFQDSRVVEDGTPEAAVCQSFKQSVSLMCTTEQVENIMIRYKMI